MNLKLTSLSIGVHTIFLSDYLLRMNGWFTKWNISKIDHLQYLSNLESLDLSGNLIQDITVLKHLKQLRYLSLSANRLSDVSELKHLKLLNSLNISNNIIDDVDFLEDLINLKILNLRANKISDINSLQKLPKLHLLNLRKNQISNIAPLKHIKYLATVDLRENLINELPAWTLDKFIIRTETDHFLGRLSIDNNPITHPPKEVVKQGHPAIFRYFEELKKQGTDYIQEAKLILVGEAETGKTSLQMRLQDRKCKLPEKDERTRGVEIKPFSFKGKSEQPFRVNVWDFGGQAIYHSTHHFFLTRRSLYVLLTDTSRKEDNFDYWIPNIHLFGDDSPILIVKNCKYGYQRNISIARFQKEKTFNLPVTPLEVNLKTNEGLEKLEEEIKYRIQQLPHVGQAVPKTWVRVRKVLKSSTRQQAYMPYSSFEELCSKHGIEEKLKVQDLGRYLHDLGILLWYHDKGMLRHKVILRPEWATEAVYRIIDDPIIMRIGAFTQADLMRLWADDDYKEMHQELLELMQEFRLCYNRKNRDEYIIPSLLPADPKAFAWDDTDNLRLEYHYEFMPKGIVNQLTAALHRYITDDGRVWSLGVVLEDTEHNTEAKVEEERSKRRLKIRVKGEDKRAFLRTITDALDDIHESYGGIRVEKIVPCPCENCTNAENPTTFIYHKLLAWKQERDMVVCNESGEALSIRAILGNIGLGASSKASKPSKPIVISPIQQIKHFLQKGQSKQAIQKTLSLAEEQENSDVEDGVLLLQGRYKRLKRKQQRGTISKPEVMIEENKIAEILLGLVGGLN